jgi:hypothetical protein
MSYIGNQVTSVPYIIDTFTGDSVTSSFGPLTRAPAGVASVAVFTNGTYQTPGVSYTLNGDYIIFTTPPGVGVSIVIHHLGNGTTTQVPSDGSVTGTKIAVNAVRANNIVAGQIQGNLISSSVITSNHITIGAITGNLIPNGAISGNHISVGSITGNLIPNGAISGNNIVNNAIRGNNIVAGQITGNLIGTGAISSNHYAGGGVTSDVLAPNLKMSIARILEAATVTSTAAGGNVNIDLTDSLIHFLGSNTTSAMTFNLRGDSVTTFNSMVSTNQTVSVVIAVRHGTTRFAANLAIDGVVITNDATPYGSGWENSIYYPNRIKPATAAISGAEVEVHTFTITKVGSGTYTVFAGNTIFGIA